MNQISKSEFVGVINNIKNEIRTTQIHTAQQVNSNLIMMYFRIGKILSENVEYGNKFIKNISTEIKLIFPGIEGFSERNLRNMRAFYEEYQEMEKWQQLVAKLSWSHNLLLLSKIKNKSVREIYMRATIENGWSRNILAMQIESNYHKRIGRSINNFELALPANNSDLTNEIIKDPYIFDFLTLREGYREKELEKAMMEKIKNVLLEFGNGFSFMGNQYKLEIGGKDYYIDLLFYHTKLRCYVVVELKSTEFKPEYVGKIGFYLAAVDDTMKSEDDNPSIGIILCRDKDRISVEYALKKSSGPIGVSSYKLMTEIDADTLDNLPTEEELNLLMDF